ncbi:hypothetical protein [Lacrimispora saccharolytica]|uniref:Uncharacterized protein n=1 Tax=Lacrimispora saccharolytica (strain ATCC 35040 / DSM 2544 / NRCC 2533 / WM1) TaxID=610130 RepID=D9R4S5_LACSW|nr:hypothetical protein [Lacrimispora saccharolytica]ADL03259.1 hypothetical protein Closa_0631 [[Clostridium] saccharolyticum WM1]QRV18571.1 hypothetical protein I6K70_13710 [Lacrimispora saccharolytica]
MKTEENRIEMDKNAKTGLLDRIAADSGCMYLSDLRNCISKRCCCNVVAKIPATDYPLKVWEDAVCYMTGTEEDFKTAEAAKQRLLELL